MRPAAARALALGLSLTVSVGAAVAFLRWRGGGEDTDLAFQTLDEDDLDAAAAAAAAASSANPEGLRRAPIDEETVRKIMPLKGKTRVYDPFCYYRYKGNWRTKQTWREHPDEEFEIVTNSLGIRHDGELSAEPPDLRVLVAGDSHMTGVCSNAECFPGVLQTMLAGSDPERTVEVINGSHGGYSFYHYLGVLERFLDLGFRPDLFVMVVYGGNDFLGAFFWHFFHDSKRPKHTKEELANKDRVAEEHPPALGQVLNAAEYFKRGGPDEVEVALRMGREVTQEIRRLCDEESIELLVVYLPAPTEIEGTADLTRVQAGAEILQLTGDDLALVGEMGDRYMADVAAAEIPAIDLRPHFAGLDGYLYWVRDLHLNLAGHRAAADVVAPWVEQWCDRY